MIKINPNKEKIINFNVNVEGIDPSLLEYNIRISTGKIDYGFKGSNKNGKITFTIPALNEIANKEIINSLSVIRLEVNDSNNKYYLKPFEDAVKIEQSLKVEAQLTEEKEVVNNDIPVIDAVLNEEETTLEDEVDKKEDIKEEKQQKKSTKFSEFLEG